MKNMKNMKKLISVALTLLVASTGGGVTSAQNAPAYRVPPKALADLVDAPLTPLVRVSPDRRQILILERPSLPSIAELAEPELRLAGLRIQPRTGGRSRGRYFTAMTIRSLASAEETMITGIPEGLRLNAVSWSPDGRRLAFTGTGASAIHLWVAEVSTGKARRLLDVRLNPALATPFAWLADSESLIAATVPGDRGAVPEKSRLPKGPVVQEHAGGKAPARTYQDLLQNPYDASLFEYHLRAQLVRVTTRGETRNIGEPGIIYRYDPSPDGRHLLVQTIHRPFSYLVRYNRFPRRVEIRAPDGQLVKKVADLPLKEDVPVAFGSVPTGPRSFVWRPDVPATLYWTEAQDGGDARRKAEVRDRVYTWAAPFEAKPQPFFTLALRYARIEWTEKGRAFVHESWWKNRRVRTWIVGTTGPAPEPVLLWDRNWQDRYSDPGAFLSAPNRGGRDVVVTSEDGRIAYLRGRGASPDGDRPFVDRIDLESRETRRLWRSDPPHYEEPVSLLEPGGGKVLTRRESVLEPPDYFVRDLKSGELRRVTEFPHPHPHLSGLRKEILRYERADGVALSGTLYLPPDEIRKDGPLPALLWAYPREFKSASTAGQLDTSPYRFDRIGWWSPLVWLTQGYAVLDDPKLPIVGEGDEEPNDTYVEQLVAGAQAAVKEIVRRGVADPDRIAIGGHSYGAFMAANLLSHSDIFRAGIARSGAFNRTLTPFGFQAEERTFWEAPEVYFRMSPFMHAHKLNEPLLLIHGEADNNAGTHPLQSRRYYHALKGQGATVRLVMLPHESHGYRARESVMHVLWETNRWLETHVKNAAKKTAAPN